ncbi:MAG: hypothetical protein ACLFPJ_03345 [Candidatus Woesearchaeota archaeon]
MNKEKKIKALKEEIKALKEKEKTLMHNMKIFKEIIAQLNTQFEEIKKEIQK